MSLKNKTNYTQYENSLYGKILTKKEPIKTLGFYPSQCKLNYFKKKYCWLCLIKFFCIFPALFHLLTKKQKKVLTRTLNQQESGSKNTFNDHQKLTFLINNHVIL